MSESVDGSGCNGDAITITKAKYSNKNDRLKVFATHGSSSGAELTVSIAGFVTGAPMTYKASKNRYQYYVETTANLDGSIVTINASDGECAEAPIH